MSGRVARQEAVASEAGARGLGALLVTTPANVRYLTGFAGSNGIAVVAPAGRVLVTDSRYAASAGEQVEGAEVVIGTRDLLEQAAAAALDLAGGLPVGVEAEHLTLARHERLQSLLEGAQTAPTRGIVEALRAVKDPDEVAVLRRAAAVVDRALARVLDAGIVGRSERAVAFSLHQAMVEEGAEGPSFATIVAAGPRAARPHHVPGADPVPEDTLVVIDMGAIVDGYCSDMTRTVATGPLPSRLEEIHAVCLDAQAAALDAARPGMAAGDLDEVARARIAAAGYGEHFGHGLGHGVGLDIHERPGVRPESSDELAAGMAITIEPGIYLEGEGGVRIEDLVVLQEGGREVLSHTPKELRIVA